MVVERERDLAVGAPQHIAAVAADDEGGEAPPVEKEHHLLADPQAVGDGVQQALAEGLARAHQRLGPQVQDADVGHGPVVNAMG